MSDPSHVSREQIRRDLADRVCPFCDSGPWRNIATHTALRHGVTGQQLREMAGWNREHVLLDPDLHAELGRIARARLADASRLAVAVKNLTGEHTTKWRAEGCERRAKIAAERVKPGGDLYPAVKVPRGDYASIAERRDRGETVTALAREYGCSRVLIWKIVNRKTTLAVQG